MKNENNKSIEDFLSKYSVATTYPDGANGTDDKLALEIFDKLIKGDDLIKKLLDGGVSSRVMGALSTNKKYAGTQVGLDLAYASYTTSEFDAKGVATTEKHNLENFYKSSGMVISDEAITAISRRVEKEVMKRYKEDEDSDFSVSEDTSVYTMQRRIEELSYLPKWLIESIETTVNANEERVKDRNRNLKKQQNVSRGRE